MAMRVCQVDGCGELVAADTRGRRCATHRRAAELARGTRQARGYGATYDATRRDYAARMAAGQVFTCWRCGRPLGAGSDWHLGHDDTDRTVIRGPECGRRCNLSAAGRARHGVRPAPGG